MKSLGFVEVQSVAAAVDCLDIMCKAAAVDFVTWERKLGGRLVTVIVEGQLSAVKAAVEATETAIIKPSATAVIASPHSETERMVRLSASRLTKQKDNIEQAEKHIQEV
ncbi:MAG: BMC domain-containing protein [Spirochaetales bacterium]|nr:BMC domain-containing protein [Spirochaetales bacterium]